MQVVNVANKGYCVAVDMPSRGSHRYNVVLIKSSTWHKLQFNLYYVFSYVRAHLHSTCRDQPNLTVCLVVVLSPAVYIYSIPDKNGERGWEVIFVIKHHVHRLKALNCELIWNGGWRAELNCELNWDKILTVELNRESSFIAMSILKNWIWIESKHFVWIWIESWIQKKVESLHLCIPFYKIANLDCSISHNMYRADRRMGWTRS